jgi:hypothetical protein
MKWRIERGRKRTQKSKLTAKRRKIPQRPPTPALGRGRIAEGRHLCRQGHRSRRLRGHRSRHRHPLPHSGHADPQLGDDARCCDGGIRQKLAAGMKKKRLALDRPAARRRRQTPVYKTVMHVDRHVGLVVSLLPVPTLLRLKKVRPMQRRKERRAPKRKTKTPIMSPDQERFMAFHGLTGRKLFALTMSSALAGIVSCKQDRNSELRHRQTPSVLNSRPKTLSVTIINHILSSGGEVMPAW